MSGSDGPAGPPHLPLSGVFPSLVAVAVVVAIVGVLTMLFGHGRNSGSATVAENDRTARPSGSGERTDSPETAHPPRRGTPAPTLPVGTSPTQHRLPIVVFNQTTRRGLAAGVAERLESGGWQVAAVDNWRGNVPRTTVYHPDDHKATAVSLTKQYPEIGRVRPMFPGIPDDKLTVIVCDDYPAELVP